MGRILDLIDFLCWSILAVSIIFLIPVILEVKAKREIYAILEKICYVLLAIIGLIIGVFRTFGKIEGNNISISM